MNKDGLEKYKKIAKDKGGRLLSRDYTNQLGVLEFKCVKGHTFKTQAVSVKNGVWCKECKKQDLINTKSNELVKLALKIASQKKGRLLSSFIPTKAFKASWVCNNGHKFFASIGKIEKRNLWCTHKGCGKRISFTIEEMQEIARQKKGKCLTSNITVKNKKLKFQCAKGHIWETTPSLIRLGRWCGKCAGNQKEDIRSIRELLNNTDVVLLSKKYTNAHGKLLFKCLIHQKEFTRTLAYIKKTVREAGRVMCEDCRSSFLQRMNTPYKIKDLQKKARSRGGECLTKNYTNLNDLYEFRCSFGHIWQTSARSILTNNSWCPSCIRGLGEELCRSIISIATGKFFKKVRLPGFRSLELDGYNDELKMAFEYNGVQHYEETAFFHSELNSLNLIKRNDEIKLALCKKNNIDLLVIPFYEFEKLDIKEKITYLIQRIKGIKPNLKVSKVDLPELVFKHPRQNNYIQRIKILCEKRKITILQDLYSIVIDPNKTKLNWVCERGHIFKQSLANAEASSDCYECRYGLRANFESCNILAGRNNGKFLSANFYKANDTYLWECTNGHVFKKRFSDVKAGKWCSLCRKV